MAHDCRTGELPFRWMYTACLVQLLRGQIVLADPRLSRGRLSGKAFAEGTLRFCALWPDRLVPGATYNVGL